MSDLTLVWVVSIDTTHGRDEDRVCQTERDAYRVAGQAILDTLGYEDADDAADDDDLEILRALYREDYQRAMKLLAREYNTRITVHRTGLRRHMPPPVVLGICCYCDQLRSQHGPNDKCLFGPTTYAEAK